MASPLPHRLVRASLLLRLSFHSPVVSRKRMRLATVPMLLVARTLVASHVIWLLHQMWFSISVERPRFRKGQRKRKAV
jgi:hypothetical protein